MEARCCIVGAGPGGSVLAFLLARAGVSVVLVEAHADFERKFRGDTLHPPTMELMQAVSLSDRLLALPHSKIRAFTLRTPRETLQTANFSVTGSPFPYITMLPQARFIETLVEAAKKFPTFQLVQPASVEALILENGQVKGVRCHHPDGRTTEIHSTLTVAADGRSSTVRRLAGIETIKTSPPMDVLWFTLPRHSTDPEDMAGGYLGRGRILVVLERPNEWQVGYVFPKHAFQKVRAEGLEALKKSIAETNSRFADRVDSLKDWSQVALLSVESSRCKEWAKPGLLLIGDAAHVMSPVGGVGINYAIQDAVVTANVLTESLLKGEAPLRLLHQVQRKRQLPTKIIQFIQGQFQKFIISQALDSSRPFQIPKAMRFALSVPILREIPLRLLIKGIGNVHLKKQSVNSNRNA